MKAEAWIAWRLLFSRKTLYGGSAPLALAGLVLGVACLVASMAVMSGFEATLRQAMSDVTGHVQVIKKARMADEDPAFESRLREWEPSLKSLVRFLRLEALLARNGKIQGVLIQAVESDRWTSVLDFSSRLKEGELSLQPQDDIPGVLIGQGMARHFELRPGDRFKMVLPLPGGVDPDKFSRKVGEFYVRGILDLGKYEWNERLILADLKAAQIFGEVGSRSHGWLLKFPSPEEGLVAAFRLSQNLGAAYGVSDWRELNANLFEAVRLERPVIFFVVSIIILVAAFTVASTLFVSIVRRTEEIALLKALGLPRRALIRVFGVQGLLMGATGLILGFGVGFLLCLGFAWLQNRYGMLAGSVYRVEGIRVAIRGIDLLAISLVTLGICFLATLAPALRGSRLSPVEGLRHG